MSVKIVKTCAVAAWVGLAAGVALADGHGAATVANPYGQIDVMPGGFYVGAAGGVQWMTLPDWGYGAKDTLNFPFRSKIEFDGDAMLYGGQLWFGRAIDAGPGEHTRIQLEGSYAEGDFNHRQSREEPGGNDLYVILDASDSNTFASSGDTLAVVEVDVRSWEVGLRALTDARSDTSGAFTPSLMIFGGANSQDYDANIFDRLPCPDCNESFVRQDVDTWQVGVEAAFAATVNLTPAVTIAFGGRVAGLYFDADMDGVDCIDSELEFGCDGFNGTSSVSDGLTAVTYRGGGFVGLNYDFGGASVGIMGTADYVPMADIVNPLFVGDSPSHLDLIHEAVYSARGSIVIPLN